MAQPGSRSRFKGSEMIIVGGKETYGLWKRPDFLKEENLTEDKIIKVQIDQTNVGRPDIIARQYYGDDRLEWVVILSNNPLNPIGWPAAGTVIQIPTSSVVYSNT